MINCKEGIINNIIYNNTVYHNGKYRFYPSLMELKNLARKITETKTTTRYIRFIPFYINAKLDRQVEFDKYLFYMECRAEFNTQEYEKFIQECEGKPFNEMSNDEVRCAKIQYVMCEDTNVERFAASIKVYMNYLIEIIPKMVEELKKEYKIKNEDLMFGYFCFEVDSE